MTQFSIRIEELKADIGVGELVGRVEFNQVYAHRQHEEVGWKHPRGGGPKYLERALYENVDVYMELLAQGLLTGELKEAMVAVTNKLADNAQHNAPVRAGFLRNSAHPSVSDNGEVIYDRPPDVPRLTQEEIETLNEELQDPHHYYGRWPPS